MTHWAGPAADSDGDGYLNVRGAAQGNGFTLATGGSATVALKWNGWPTTRQDLDLVLMSTNQKPTGPSDSAIVKTSTRHQADSAQPLTPTEEVSITNETSSPQVY